MASTLATPADIRIPPLPPETEVMLAASHWDAPIRTMWEVYRQEPSYTAMKPLLSTLDTILTEPSTYPSKAVVTVIMEIGEIRERPLRERKGIVAVDAEPLVDGLRFQARRQLARMRWEQIEKAIEEARTKNDSDRVQMLQVRRTQTMMLYSFGGTLDHASGITLLKQVDHILPKPSRSTSSSNPPPTSHASTSTSARQNAPNRPVPGVVTSEQSSTLQTSTGTIQSTPLGSSGSALPIPLGSEESETLLHAQPHSVGSGRGADSRTSSAEPEELPSAENIVWSNAHWKAVYIKMSGATEVQYRRLKARKLIQTGPYQFKGKCSHCATKQIMCTFATTTSVICGPCATTDKSCRWKNVTGYGELKLGKGKTVHGFYDGASFLMKFPAPDTALTAAHTFLQKPPQYTVIDKSILAKSITAYKEKGWTILATPRQRSDVQSTAAGHRKSEEVIDLVSDVEMGDSTSTTRKTHSVKDKDNATSKPGEDLSSLDIVKISSIRAAYLNAHRALLDAATMMLAAVEDEEDIVDQPFGDEVKGAVPLLIPENIYDDKLSATLDFLVKSRTALYAPIPRRSGSAEPRSRESSPDAPLAPDLKGKRKAPA